MLRLSLNISKFRHHRFLALLFTFTVCFTIFNAQSLFRLTENVKKALPYTRIEEGQIFRFPEAELEFDRSLAKYLIDLGFNEEPISIENGLPDFTFVTALSDNHAAEGRHLVLNISKAFPGRKIVVFGMNLSKIDQEWYENACNVDFRIADLSRYPDHVSDTSNYAFKPLLIAEALKEFGAVFWTDTSSLFDSMKSTENFLKRIETLDLKENDPRLFLMIETGHLTGAATHPGLYRYLPMTKEASFSQMQFGASAQLIYRTTATMHSVYKWCVLCALEKNCAVPPGSQQPCDLPKLWNGEYANGHRYDQSVVNIVMEPYKLNFLNSSINDGFVGILRDLQLDASTVIHCD